MSERPALGWFGEKWEHDPDREPGPMPDRWIADLQAFVEKANKGRATPMPIRPGNALLVGESPVGGMRIGGHNDGPAWMVDGVDRFPLRPREGWVLVRRAPPLLYGAKVEGRIVAVAVATRIPDVVGFEAFEVGIGVPNSQREATGGAKYGRTPQQALAPWGGEVVALGEVGG